MASRQQIKQQIRSVKNTRQTTKAMQMVSASKLRRAQEAVVGPREYARVAGEMLMKLRSLHSGGAKETSLFAERKMNHRVIVMITSDRTLAGAYNANVIRQTVRELLADKEAGVKTSVVCIGRQAARAAARFQDVHIVAVYQDLPDKITPADLRPLLDTITAQFTESEGDIDAVDVIYTAFASTIRQEVKQARLLPAGYSNEPVDTTIAENITVEPSADELIASATLRLLDAQLYQMVLESAASEHAMRMLAMKNATDNASDLIDDYTLEYNNARQAAITQELAEISGGMAAMT
jgi:F-type H+-transporting ATPase subunit gamma